jgi:cytochrome b pre-mRNA-processing protein 3
MAAACRSCLRELLGRIASVRTEAHSHGAAITQLARLPRAPATQRRSLRTSAERLEKKSSVIPQSVKDAGSKLLRSTAQPYQINRATEDIYKACAKEATYTISEADKKNGTVPKTEEGEEIGIGKGSWHKGMFVVGAAWELTVDGRLANAFTLHLQQTSASCPHSAPGPT